MFAKLIDWFKGWPAPAPDLTPEEEDKAAYEFVDKVLAEYSNAKDVYQILRDGAKPSDTALSTKLAKPASMSYWVDVYEGPKGSGFVIQFEALRAGSPYRKSVNFGPEAHREQDWTLVKEA